MAKTAALIVGQGTTAAQRLRTHLSRRGLRVQQVPDCGAALEMLGPPDAAGGAGDIKAVVLDVQGAGLGAQAFREMVSQEYPRVSLLELPPELAGPEDVGLMAAAIVQHAKRPRDPVEDGEEAEDFEGTFHGIQFEDLESRSPSMLELFDLIPRVARTDSPVLIRGETGVGKELVAAAIHRQSLRREGEFFTINCGALSESLLESELFGHVRGSFTGAVKDKAGYFELADGGTLFLDELGTISMPMQVRLLRVLERMELRRVGGERLRKVDVRVVAATNASLEEEVERGTFREDLYYRLNVVQLRIPPLRERIEDVPLLAEVFRRKFVRNQGRSEILRFSPATLTLLSRYPWPGNVRELENVIERAVILAQDGMIEDQDLPERIRTPAERRTALPPFDVEEPLQVVVERVRSALEREYLKRVLRRYKGHLGRAADHAGVNRRTLYNKMQHLGLRRDDFR